MCVFVGLSQCLVGGSDVGKKCSLRYRSDACGNTTSAGRPSFLR